MNRESWNKFVLENRGSFLQSWEWGEFQKNYGRKIARFSGNGWTAQFIEMTIPIIGKKYWHCPRGPVMANFQMEELIARVKTETKDQNVIFFRVGPEWNLGRREALEKEGFKKLHYDMEPSETLIMDISTTEEELLAQMHEKWRYNIRLAERKGIKVKSVSSDDADFEKYFEAFYKLTDKGTAERKHIRHFSKDYYRGQLEIKSDDLKLVIFAAEHEGKVIAANIAVYFGERATYLHGATDNEYRNLMAPHLLQWEQIKEAKRQGCAEYDFWGIVNEHTVDKRGSSWEGFTRFKKGFGGREENYVGYFDYPLSRFWYFAYKLAQKIRR